MRMRSLFWPLFLIAAGAVWFLVALGTVPASNLWAVLNFVPYLLLGLGISLLLRARWQLAGMIASGVVVLAAFLAVLFAAQLHWNTPPDWGCQWSTSPFVSCTGGLDLGGGVRGSGHVVSESRPVPDFTAVSVDYPAEVTIQQGSAVSASLQAEDNLLPQLELRVVDGVLHIDNRETLFSQRVNPTRPVKITLTVKDLSRLDAPSAGDVTIDGLQTQTLDVNVSGAGSVALSGLKVQTLGVDLSGAGSISASGTAASLNLTISGLGSFKAADLAADRASVDLSGLGSATLWVKTSLDVSISGTGSVEYYGSPSLSQSVSGLGSVSALGSK